jgi:hypothetical protein
MIDSLLGAVSASQTIHCLIFARYVFILEHIHFAVGCYGVAVQRNGFFGIL